MTTLTLLGCGGSAGVPVIGNHWGACDPTEPKNRRTRCSVLIQSQDSVCLIDSGPDIKEQLNRAGVSYLDAVLYTHSHGDHINGFDELRNLYNVNRKTRKELIPLYADAKTQNVLRTSFPFMFYDGDTTGFYPMPVRIAGWEEGAESVTIRDITLTLIPMIHGPDATTGFRIGDTAYCTDVSVLTETAFERLAGVKTLIIDCNNIMKDEGHYLHFGLSGIMAANERIQAPDVILTHLKSNCDYHAVSKTLPDGYRLAYDGLIIDSI